MSFSRVSFTPEICKSWPSVCSRVAVAEGVHGVVDDESTLHESWAHLDRVKSRFWVFVEDELAVCGAMADSNWNLQTLEVCCCKHRVPIVCDSDCVQSFGLLSNCCSKSLHLQRCWITSCNLIAHSYKVQALNYLSYAHCPIKNSFWNKGSQSRNSALAGRTVGHKMEEWKF